MRLSYLPHPRLLLLPLCCLLFSVTAHSQTPQAETRIVERINEGSLATLRGNTHPLAQAQFDQGIAPPDLPMSRMLLLLKRSDAQESALEALLDAQQDPNSPSYHQWLTPDAFGQEFGPSDQDVQTIAAWLGSHGFQIGGISRSRTVIEFSGTAAQVQQAFHTEIHKFVVNGESHWANASDPQIPAALSPVIVGVNSLHNFYKKPAHHIGGVFSKSRATGEVKSLSPGFTIGNSNFCGASGTCYFVGPYDFAKIYNVLPLWNASPAIDGTGQSIAIIGRSDIVLQDVRDFQKPLRASDERSQFHTEWADPGIVTDDETEALLDVEWSGAVAKGAKINLVISGSTETTDGIDLSALYAIENNVAPVVNESFSVCELFLGTAGNTFQNAIREQAAAQGITFLTSTGDDDAAACDVSTGNPPEAASHGLMVSGLASSPYGVAVGGTDFLNYGPNYTRNSLSVASPYWTATNDTNQASAIGYVPESTWNDTCTNNIFVVYNYGATPEAGCNNSRSLNWVDTFGGSGGKSSCVSSDGSTASSCTGGYAKPTWQQSVPGVPADGARDIPDVSLFASAGFMGSAYILCEADQTQTHGTCGLTGVQYDFLAIGGTSASSPAFAGIMALVNQYTQSAGQGNANHVLYKLASSTAQRSANCNSSASPASGCIFNDVTSGTIATPCAAGSLNCTTSVGSDTYGILSGYSASTGYDLATGLGSVNAYNLVHSWGTPGISTTTALSLNSGNAVSITHGQPVPFNIAVTPSAATGNVSLTGSPSTGTSVPMGSFLTLQNGAVTGTTASLAGGSSYQVKAHYAGDSVYAPSDSAPITVTVSPEPSKTLISIPVFDPKSGAETADVPTTISYGSPYIERVDVGNATATLGFPMKPVCTPGSCPTGIVALSDSLNGGAQTTLGAGAYPLNSEGYAEYFSIQLSGGTHELSANYPGDNSYGTSTGSYTVTVTPAGTTMSQPYGFTSIPALVGTSVQIGAGVTATTQFPGAAPTGTITFYDGATPISGTVTYSSIPGSPNNVAMFSGSITESFTTTGPHQISAKYSGDPNYAANSSSVTMPVVYLTTLSGVANPSTIYQGQSSTVTVTVSSNSKQPPMTGTFQFTGVSGTIPGTPGTDSNGNQTLMATASVTPPGVSNGLYVSYSGDANYEQASNYLFLAVNIPDFNLSAPANPLVITDGQIGNETIAVAPTSSVPSTVNLSCGGSVPVGYACVVSPSAVNLSNSVSGSFVLALTPTGTGASTAAHRASAIRRVPGFPMHPPGFAGIGLLCAMASLVLFFAPEKSLRVRVATRVITISLACLALGCGGGPSGGGGGGGTQPTATPTVTTLTTSAAKVPQYSQVTLTATVSGAGSPTGTVEFFASGFNMGSSGLVGNVATMTTTVYNLGIVNFTAQYLGDPLNSLSNSAAVTEAVTGSTTVYVQGQTGSLTHVTDLTVTLQ